MSFPAYSLILRKCRHGEYGFRVYSSVSQFVSRGGDLIVVEKDIQIKSTSVLLDGSIIIIYTVPYMFIYVTVHIAW